MIFLVEKFGLTSHSLGVLYEYGLVGLFRSLTETASQTLKNPVTLISGVFLLAVHRARPLISCEQLSRLGVILIHLSNLRDEKVIDSLHALKCLQLLVAQTDSFLENVNYAVLRQIIDEKNWQISMSNEEAKDALAYYFKHNEEKFRKIFDELGHNIEPLILEKHVGFQKLVNKFGKSVQFRNDCDVAFEFFAKKLKSMK